MAMEDKEIRNNPEKMDSCWKHIGVWGKDLPRCPKLEEVVHCANCDIFSRAGRKLFERELLESYKDEWTETISGKKKEKLPGTISVVIFRICEEWLALRSSVFSEVIDTKRLQKHSIPHRNSSILLGIVNVNGDLKLCVSLKNLLGIESENSEWEKKNPKKRMIVMDCDGDEWVFPVHEIRGIVRVHPNIFENVPVTVAKSQSTFTKDIFSWKGKHVALLDDELLRYSLTRNVQ